MSHRTYAILKPIHTGVKKVSRTYQDKAIKQSFKNVRGFALPTILIGSIVMLIVLVGAVTATTATRTALNEQYYDQLAQAAGDAGVAYAKACLNANANTPQWSNANPLMPNTNCSGAPNGGYSCPSATDTRCSVTLNGNIRSSFSVGMPTLDSDGHAVTIPKNGFVDILRTSNSAVWRTYKQQAAQPAVAPGLCSANTTGALGWSNAVITSTAAFFPEPLARQITLSAGSINVGPIFFRKDFSVTKAGLYTLNNMGDDRSEVSIDGSLVSTAIWSGYDTQVVNLAVGCHTVVAKVLNRGLLTNAAGLNFSLKLPGASTPIVVSDGSWRVTAGSPMHFSDVDYYADPNSWIPVRDMGTAVAFNASWTGASGDAEARRISTTYGYDVPGNYPANQFTLMRDNRILYVPTNTTVKLTFLCDDTCYTYLDGSLIKDGVSYPEQVVSVTVYLSAGAHRFGILFYNDTGASAFAFSAVRISDGVVLTQSDLSWTSANFWTGTNPTSSYSYANSYTPNPDPTPIAQCPCNQYQAAVLASGPYAYWPLNETTGTVAADISGSGLNGTYYGLVTLNQPGPLSASSNHAVLFGGSGTVAKVTMATSAVWNRSNGQAFSVETWIKPNWTGGYRDIIVNRGTSGTYNWILYQHATDGSLQLHGAAQNKSTFIPPNGVWSHVVATVDTSSVSRLYVNGVLVQTVAGYAFGASPGSVVHIGNGPSDVNEPFNGSMDDVALYNKTLSQAEISAHYAARTQP